MGASRRRKWSLVRVIAWAAQYPIAIWGYLQWDNKLFLLYLVLISVQTGVEGAFAAYAADSD